MKELKSKSGFGMHAEILEAAKNDVESERASNEQTLETIKEIYKIGGNQKEGYILNLHSAVGIAAALRSMKRASTLGTYHIALAVAHPAPFSHAASLRRTLVGKVFRLS